MFCVRKAVRNDDRATRPIAPFSTSYGSPPSLNRGSFHRHPMSTMITPGIPPFPTIKLLSPVSSAFHDTPGVLHHHTLSGCKGRKKIKTLVPLACTGVDTSCIANLVLWRLVTTIGSCRVLWTRWISTEPDSGIRVQPFTDRACLIKNC